MNRTKKIDWILKQHKDTNHKYDEYIDYEFHLRMVVATAAKYLYLLPDSNDGETSFRDNVILAAWGHDLIEDTRTSFNEVNEQLGLTAANIIYAVTNEKGRTRKERANVAYYKGIRQTPGAVFVKLCDRIANVQYSKMTGSRMFEMYQKENSDFIQELGWFGDVTDPNYELFCTLQELFIEPRKEK